MGGLSSFWVGCRFLGDFDLNWFLGDLALSFGSASSALAGELATAG